MVYIALVVVRKVLQKQLEENLQVVESVIAALVTILCSNKEVYVSLLMNRLNPKRFFGTKNVHASTMKLSTTHFGKNIIDIFHCKNKNCNCSFVTHLLLICLFVCLFFLFSTRKSKKTMDIRCFLRLQPILKYQYVLTGLFD